MSAALALHTPLLEALRADPVVTEALGGLPKVYEDGVTNLVEPYLQLGPFIVLPELAGCYDGEEIEVSVDAWSRTDPPGRLEAMRIIAAAMAVLAPVDASGDRQPPDWVVPGYRITSALPVRQAHLMDIRDVQSAHSVGVVKFTLEPL